MMNEHQIDFSPGSLARKYIQNDFSDKKWKKFKTWFFDTYSEEDLNNISQEFYETCALHNHIMFFVPWFITTYLPLFINVLDRSYKNETSNIIIPSIIFQQMSSFTSRLRGRTFKIVINLFSVKNIEIGISLSFLKNYYIHSF